MKCRWAVMVCAVTLVCSVGWMTFADVGDYPVTWSWKPIYGDANDAVTFPDLHRMVLVRTRVWDVYEAVDPRVAVKEAMDFIQAEGLGDGEVDILLSLFGMGGDPNYDGQFGVEITGVGAPKLTFHPDDAIVEDPDHPYDSSCCETGGDPNCCLQYWRTPWMTHGIYDGYNPSDPNWSMPARLADPNLMPFDTAIHGSKRWIRLFIAEYKRCQALNNDPNDPNYLPDPTRFHFDTESLLTHSPGKDQNAKRLFLWMRKAATDPSVEPNYVDTRWCTESLPGHDKTLAQLWYEYCAEQDPNTYNDPNDTCTAGIGDEFLPDPGATWGDHAWLAWWTGVVYEAIDGGLNEAAYSLLSDPSIGWADCKSSNYITSSRFDGVIEDSYDAYAGGRWIFNPNSPATIHTAWEGSGELQAPVLYAFNDTYLDTDDASSPLDGMTYDDAMLYTYRHRLNSSINSFPASGTHEDEITPWVSLPFEDYTSDGDYRDYYTKDALRRLLALLRAKQIDELILYCSSVATVPHKEHGDSWSTYADLMHQVWDSDLYSVATQRRFGSYVYGPAANAEYSDDTFISTNSFSDTASGKQKVSFEIEFETAYCDYGDPNDPDDDVCPQALRTFVETAVTNATSNVTVELTMYDCDDAGAFETIGNNITLADGERANTHWDVTENAGDYINDTNDRVTIHLTYLSDNSFTVQLDCVLLVETDDEPTREVGDYPDVYAYFGPNGPDAGSLPFHPRYLIGNYATNPDPVAWARSAYQAVQQSGQTDHIWIDFVNFGWGSYASGGVPLSYHPDDALRVIMDPNDPNYFDPTQCPGPNDPDYATRPSGCALMEVLGDEFWKTPWYTHGINDPDPTGVPGAQWGMKAWMMQFVDTYDDLRENGDANDPSITAGAPAPARFHFDNEIQAGVVRSSEGVSLPLLFHALRECSSGRWGDPNDPDVGERLPGYDKTLAVLFREFCEEICGGDPNCDCEEDVFPDRDGTYASPAKNQVWYGWWYGIGTGALDAAMKEAAYDVIAATWPDCKCSNYESSSSLDGEGENNIWSLFSQIDGFAWPGSSELQAPVLYPVSRGVAEVILENELGISDPNVNDDVLFVEANLWRFRHDLDACQNSFSGASGEEITPWIHMPGVALGDASRNLDPNGVYDGSRRLLSLLRAKGINEFILYQGASTVDPNGADWTKLTDLIHQVWDSALRSTEVIDGFSYFFASLKAAYSDEDFLEVDSVYSGSAYQVCVEFVFDTAYCDYGDPGDPNDDVCPDSLRTFVETVVTNATSSVTLDITMYDFDDAEVFETVGSSITLTDDDRMNTYRDVTSNAGDYIRDSDDRVRVRLTYTSTNSFTVKLDSVLLVENDD